MFNAKPSDRYSFILVQLGVFPETRCDDVMNVFEFHSLEQEAFEALGERAAAGVGVSRTEQMSSVSFQTAGPVTGKSLASRVW